MVKERIIEGGAIEDNEEMSMEEYSATMEKMLGREYMEFVNYVADEINPPLNAKVLEVGPGPGWIGIWLISKRRSDIIIDGLEPSSDMRRIAEQNADREGVRDKVNYIHGFVEDLNMIQDETYDMVISNESLHHWVDPIQGLREIKRVLKPNGLIYIQDGRRDLGLIGKLIVNVFGRLAAGKMLKHWKNSINASYTLDEIEDILKKVPNNHWNVKSNVLGLSIQS